MSDNKLNAEKIGKKIEAGLEVWTDEEVMTLFSLFLEEVSIATQFVQNDDGLITHQVMMMSCGDKILCSNPAELDWPLQVLPKPEAFKEIN